MESICFIELQPFPTTIGGGITHLAELSKELIRQGHTVSIITSPSSEKFKLEKDLKKLKLYHVGLKHRKMEQFLGIKKIFYYPWRIFFEISFIFGANKILKNNFYNVIDCQSPITSSLPCSLFGREFFITAHGIHHEGFKKLYAEKRNFVVSEIASRIYVLMENFNVRRAKKIICLGKNSFEHYSKIKNSVIIPNGIDVKKFSRGMVHRKKIILSVGRLTEQKAIDKLILSMDFLPDYELLIIGLGPLEDQIKELCSKRVNCKFLGYKNQEEVATYFKKARFTVLPSLFEGLPIAMLEAMSAGVIPIATRVGDIPLVIKPGKVGFFLKNNSSKEITKTIRIAEKSNLRLMSARCSDLIRKDYNWGKIAKDYLRTWKN